MAITTRHPESYSYMVRNKITGQYYYGFRSKNVSENRFANDDLWVHYFTSSKKVATLVGLYGAESFTAEILRTHNDPDQSYWYEQQMIKDSFLEISEATQHT